MVNLAIYVLISFSTFGFSYACSGATLLRSGGLTCHDKELIIDTHNKLRQKVALGQANGQPSAVNMLELTWDEELARGAQRWADNCVFQHNSQNDRRVSRFQVGQNLALAWSSPRPDNLGPAPDFVKNINLWFNEVNNYQGRYSSAVGHYTQPFDLLEGYIVQIEEMVWSDTYLVGCGYSYFLRGSQYTKFYVCNYGPAGNIRGLDPYKRGRPSCTLQGTSPSRRYPGLCTVQGYLSRPCSYYYF